MWVQEDEDLKKTYCTICGTEQVDIEFDEEEQCTVCSYCGEHNRVYTVKEMMDFTNIVLCGRNM